MADLENLLLEAAGRTKAGKETQKISPASDSIGKDPKENRDKAIKKEASSQIPLKKRYEQAKREEGVCDDESDSNVGSDLYKDEDDRKRLAAMTELEREMILSDRAAKRDDKTLKERLKKSKSNPQSQRSRSSPRTAGRAFATATAAAVPSQLREKRLRQKKGLVTFGRTTKEKGPTPASPNSSSSEDIEEEEEEEEPPLFGDIKGVTIRRSELGKWLAEPFFEELVAGCFVRVGIGTSESGPVYRLCQVRAVDSSTEYEVEGRSTRKWLVCFWGSEASAASWKMAVVSDSPPTEVEFSQWAREVDRQRGLAVRRRDVAEKAASLERARGCGYWAAAANRRPKEEEESKRKLARPRSASVAVVKDRLRRELEAAEGRNDTAEAERVKGQLAMLEASRRAPERDIKAVKLTEMNRRNRAENLRNASGRSAEKAEGGGGYDPFSRRWTWSRNCYEAVAGVVGSVGGGKFSEAGAPVTGQRRTESNAMHDFEISISEETVKSLGGHRGAQLGFMARKQRIEAAIGFRVSENDGERHARTITVSDYIRRRGLL